MDITEYFNSNVPVRRASHMCGISYSKALALYTHLRMEEYSPSGMIRKNLHHVAKLERDLFDLLDQHERSPGPHLDEVIENYKLEYSQFDALSITQTI